MRQSKSTNKEKDDLVKQENRWRNKRIEMKRFFILLTSALLFSNLGFAQDQEESKEKVGPIEIDYQKPKEYIIGGLSVKGTITMDPNLLAYISGLSLNDKVKIPGDKISRAIENIWKQQVYSNVELKITGAKKDTVYLLIQVTERAKLSKYSIKGLNKTETK